MATRDKDAWAAVALMLEGLERQAVHKEAQQFDRWVGPWKHVSRRRGINIGGTGDPCR